MADHTFILGSTWDFQDVQSFINEVEADHEIDRTRCAFDGLKKQFTITCALEQREISSTNFMRVVDDYVEAERQAVGGNSDALELPKVTPLPEFGRKTETQALYEEIDGMALLEPSTDDAEAQSSLIVHEIFTHTEKMRFSSDTSQQIFSDAVLWAVGDLTQSRIELINNNLHLFTDSESKIQQILGIAIALEEKYTSESALPSAFDFYFNETETCHFFRFKFTRHIVDYLLCPEDALIARYYELDMVKWDITSRQYVMEPTEFQEQYMEECLNLWPKALNFAFGNSRGGMGNIDHPSQYVSREDQRTSEGVSVSFWAQHVEEDPIDAFSLAAPVILSSIPKEKHRKTTRYPRGIQFDDPGPRLTSVSKSVLITDMPMPGIEPIIEHQQTGLSEQEPLPMPRIVRSNLVLYQKSDSRRNFRSNDLIKLVSTAQSQKLDKPTTHNENQAGQKSAQYYERIMNSNEDFVKSKRLLTDNGHFHQDIDQEELSFFSTISYTENAEEVAIPEVKTNKTPRLTGNSPHDLDECTTQDEFLETVQLEEESQTRKYTHTTSLLAPKSRSRALIPELFPQVWKGLARIIDTARYQYRARVNLQLELGKVFIEAASVPEEWRCSDIHPAKGFKPELWSEIFRMHRSRGHASTVFSSRISSPWSSAQRLANVMQVKDEISLTSMIHGPSFRQRTYFMIHCQDDITKDEIVIEVQGNGRFFAFEPEKQLGRVNVQFPKHTWDASFSVHFARERNSKSKGQFQCIIDNLWIRGWNDMRELTRPILVTRSENKNIKIISVELHRIATFLVSEKVAIGTDLHLTQVQQLHVESLPEGEYHARVLPEELAITDGRSWWETAITSSQIDKLFRDSNLDLEIGEIASYAQLDKLKASAQMLLNVAKLLVPKADIIGPLVHLCGESDNGCTSFYRGKFTTGRSANTARGSRSRIANSAEC